MLITLVAYNMKKMYGNKTLVSTLYFELTSHSDNFADARTVPIFPERVNVWGVFEKSVIGVVFPCTVRMFPRWPRVVL